MRLDAQALTELRADAARTRASWLASVSAGLVSPDDVVRFAASDDGRHLRRIRLVHLLESQEGWSHVRALRVLRHLALLCGSDVDKVRDLTVSWLLDARAGGGRQVHWTMCSRDVRTPCAGFPFTRIGG